MVYHTGGSTEVPGPCSAAFPGMLTGHKNRRGAASTLLRDADILGDGLTHCTTMSGLRLTLELAVGNLNNYMERTHVSVPVDTLLAPESSTVFLMQKK